MKGKHLQHVGRSTIPWLLRKQRDRVNDPYSPQQ